MVMSLGSSAEPMGAGSTYFRVVMSDGKRDVSIMRWSPYSVGLPFFLFITCVMYKYMPMIRRFDTTYSARTPMST